MMNNSLSHNLDECNTDLTAGKWNGFGDFCYQVGNDWVTQEEAEDACRERGALLTSIHSDAEQDFLEGKIFCSRVVWNKRRYQVHSIMHCSL